MTTTKPEKKIFTSMLLTRVEHDRLNSICKDRSQSKVDFFRGAMQVPDLIPLVHTYKLSGVCLERHLARLKREKREARRRRLVQQNKAKRKG